MNAGPPRSSGCPSLVVVDWVRERVHNTVVGEDGVEVGENVMGGESYELTTNPIHSPEEVESVKWVSERSEDPNHNAVVGDLLNMVHPRRAAGEVEEAGRKEELGEVPCGPQP